MARTLTLAIIHPLSTSLRNSLFNPHPRLPRKALSDSHPCAPIHPRLCLPRRALFNAHVESQLKQEIMDEPEKFVVLDPELALTLLDQKGAGKKLLLITNSDFAYTDKLMSFAYDRYLPEVI